MPQGMPYHLEKGPTLRLLEQHLNLGRASRRHLLDTLRASAGTIDWVQQGLPALWADPRFAHAPQGGGTAVRDDIARRWFGYTDAGGTWAPAGGATTGYWIAYQGQVAEIVRRALVWAVELSLGLDPGGTGPGRTKPWGIELFWKCPAPWFEAWVVQRPHDLAATGRGLISVVLVTPSHVGSNVAESPLATGPTTMPAGANHPVPSWQDDYEVQGRPFPGPATGRPRVAPSDRRFATWVVTHEDHQLAGSSVVTVDTTEEADFAEWGIPQLGIYQGTGDVVVVAPSLPAGGVTVDGAV